MHRINDANVQTRFSSGLARTVELMCPRCLQIVLFETRPWQEHGQHLTAAEADCPRCDQSLQLVQLTDTQGGPLQQGLFSAPAPAEREPMSGIAQLHELAPALARTYQSALRLYNHGEWAPAMLTGRHLLEGLARQLLPESEHDAALPRQLDALPDALDLARPLRTLTALLVRDKAFGHEFDNDTGVSREAAGQMLELVEQLIAYVVVLPAVVDALQQRIATAPVPLRRSDVA